MGETLEALHRLQEVERQLAVIRNDRESKLRKVRMHRRRVRQTEEALQEILREIQFKQIKVNEISLEVAAKEQATNKHREALNKAKTNKDYSAILAAMNTEKADSAKLENAILELMEQIQLHNETAERMKAEKAKHCEQVEAAEKMLADFDEAVRKRQEALLAEREQCAAGISPTTLASFTRVAEHLDGEAMAPVTKLHPKRDEYVCSGCHMTITLEIVNALQSRDELQLCKSCGRILYLESSPSHT